MCRQSGRRPDRRPRGAADGLTFAAGSFCHAEKAPSDSSTGKLSFPPASKSAPRSKKGFQRRGKQPPPSRNGCFSCIKARWMANNFDAQHFPGGLLRGATPRRVVDGTSQYWRRPCFTGEAWRRPATLAHHALRFPLATIDMQKSSSLVEVGQALANRTPLVSSAGKDTTSDQAQRWCPHFLGFHNGCARNYFFAFSAPSDSGRWFSPRTL